MEKTSAERLMTWKLEPRPRGHPTAHKSPTLRIHPCRIGQYTPSRLVAVRQNELLNQEGDGAVSLHGHPTEHEIAFVSGKSPEWRIRIINLKTREEEILPPKIQGDNMLCPAWSPDGKKLAFSVWRWEGEPSIYIVGRDGKAHEEIVKNTFGTLAWSPDGKKLLYPKTIGDSDLLYKIDLASRAETRLARIGPRKHGNGNNGWDWFDPNTLSISPKSHLLTTVWGKIKITN